MKNSILKFSVLFLALISLSITACKKDKDDPTPSPPATPTQNKIIANGGYVNGADTTLSDGIPLAVVQTIPTSYRYHSKAVHMSNERQTQIPYIEYRNDSVFPANTPIIFFFNDTINLQSVTNNINITVDGKPVYGNIIINGSAQGYAVISVIPFTPFTENHTIIITLSAALQAADGDYMTEDLVLAFLTGAISDTPFDNNLGFETNNTGTYFIGDGDILETTGDVSPQEGTKYAAITSGDQLVSTSNAIGGASSVLIAGPINKNANTISFDYDFMSTEFNEYVNSQFDDSFIVNIYGPKGSVSKIVTTVNTVGYNNTEVNFPGIPDDGDEYAGHTGWVNTSINVSSVGSPMFIVFVVTDVSDLIYSSVVAIDNVKLQ